MSVRKFLLGITVCCLAAACATLAPRGNGLEKIELGPGQRIHVPPKTIHRMTAIEDTDVFEVSTPELDDVVRLEDRYGRQGT